MDPVSQYFSDQLHNKLSGIINEIVLFGSRARGDNTAGSDYDFLVVLEKRDKQIVRVIRDIEVDILNKFDILSASLIYNVSEWEQRQGFPIGMNIQKEGIWLWPRKKSRSMPS